MKPFIQRGIALGALLSLLIGGGCKVGNDYQPPQAMVNSSYLKVDESKGVRQEVGADVSSWWYQVQDPVLSQLTREAVADNLTLREALYRIQAARAVLGSTRADMAPQVSEVGGYTYGTNGGHDYSAFDLTTAMDWEIDVFGRLARATEAATVDMEEMRELYRNAYVILCADVAQAYVNARSYQEQIRISEENIEIQRSTLKITQTKNEFGSASKLDENQALGVCRGTEANVLTLQTQYQKTLNQLSILIGRPPGHVDELMQEPEPIPTAPEEIMVGIPADLLRRRPDVRAAEQRVIAQNARVGVAIGNLYPIFSLTGSFGLDANSVAHMFNEDAVNAAVGPSFYWNVLNFGKYRFNVEAQRFTHAELVAAYRQTVLEAARDVDDALASYVNERDRLGTLSDAVDAYTDAYELSNERYKSGQIDFQRLLDSQAGKLSYELQYIQCRASMMSSVVQLYRSLGGDWATGENARASYGDSSEQQTQTIQIQSEEAAGSDAETTPTDENSVSANTSRRSGYDPSAEWNERRQRSRERVAAALREDQTAQEEAELTVSPSPSLVSVR